MKARPNWIVAATLVALCAAAIMAAWMMSRVPVEFYVAGFLAALGMVLVLRDYRVGVVWLTVLLPWSWSPLIPQAQGFNIVTFLVVASALSLGLRRATGRETVVWLPREVFWCYVVPLAVAVAIAWPHLAIGAANFPPWVTEQEQLFTPMAFLKGKVIKPAFFVVYAFVLGNAVRDSKRPELFILALAVSALLPALAIINEVVVMGVDVTDRRHFLANLGLQVNEYGALLAIATGPLLYIAASSSATRSVRVGAGVLFGLVTTALLMTASRGAAVSLIVVVTIWLLRRRKFTDLLIGIAVVAVLAAVIPESVQERLTMGLDSVEATSTSNADDPLTKGRVQIWAALAPEFFRSPLWGGGMSSTAWNSAVTMGHVRMMHPHNLYLEILLDLGAIGAAALAFLYYRYARTMYRLSVDSSTSPLLREYFGGAFAALIGMLCAGVSGAHYGPHPDQTFLWFSFGFCFAYWKQARELGQRSPAKPFGMGVKRPITSTRANPTAKR